MTVRWTPTYHRVAAAQAVRADDVRRRSSGFGYWLLTPFAQLFIYAAVTRVAWPALSPFERVRRLLRKGPERGS